MAKNEIETAEKRGYMAGYNAGRRRGQIEKEERLERQERQEFLDRAFLAALPSAMLADNWVDHKGKRPTSASELVDMAATIARHALERRPILFIDD